MLTANVAEIRGNQQLHKGRGVPCEQGCHHGVDMSTPLLPELVPEIDANPLSYSGGGVEMYHNYLGFREFAKYGECSKFAAAVGQQKLKGFQHQGALHPNP